MPHMIWLDDHTTKTIPSTDKSFKRGFDFHIERWSAEDYSRLTIAISNRGIVGQTKNGNWLFFQLTPRDPIMRYATPDELKTLEHLPDGWEDRLILDDAGEQIDKVAKKD